MKKLSSRCGVCGRLSTKRYLRTHQFRCPYCYGQAIELHGEVREAVIAEFVADIGGEFPSVARWRELEQQAHEWP